MQKKTETVDFSRWVCLYPVYIDSKKTCQEGRRIPKNKAVDNPKPNEMAEVCKQLGFQCVIEQEKYYPRNFLLKGRIRVQLKTAEGKPLNEQIPNRRLLMLKIAALVPKLAARGSQQSQDTGGRAAGRKQKKIDKKQLV